ncbi:MAG: Ribosomal protein [Candidatus Paceibacter sp.]|jgi:ribosomal protein S6|nr:Ribosomal protein [Candidatus Paceibacter sp.]
MNNDKRVKVYEVGYLLLPTIPEEHLATEVQNIKSVIEKHEGAFITEDFPKLRPLAYEMRKSSAGQSHKFDKAYFGWIKFEVNGSSVPALTKELEKNQNILRFMVINTIRENTMYTQKTIFRPTEGAVVEETGEPKEKMSEEEIDKTIENLVVE